MAAKEVQFGDSARQRMVHGVNILADAVKVTRLPDSMLRRNPPAMAAWFLLPVTP